MADLPCADPREVEMVSRCCRVWVDMDTVDPDAAAMAERVLHAGMQQLRHIPYMVSGCSLQLPVGIRSGYPEHLAATQHTAPCP